jgi:hypothetical protein
VQWLAGSIRPLGGHQYPGRITRGPRFMTRTRPSFRRKGFRSSIRPEKVGRIGVEQAHGIYLERFPDAGSDISSRYRFYVLRPRRVKLFDEQNLGAGLFVTAGVKTAGELAWERTEVDEGRNHGND